MSTQNSPFSWTEEYVHTHRAECLTHLKNMNEHILYDLLEDESYDGIVAGINGITKGLLILTISEIQDEELDVQIIEYMIAEGLLLVLGTLHQFKELSESVRSEQALKTFRQVLTMGQYYTGRDSVMGMVAIAFRFVEDLEMGVPLYQIRQKQVDEFPNLKESVALTLNDGRKRLDRIVAAETAPPPREVSYRQVQEERPRQEERYVPAAVTAAPAVSAPPPPAAKPKKRGGWLWKVLLLAVILAAGYILLVDRPIQHSAGQWEEDASSGEEAGGFIFPNSGTELIGQQEVEALSDYELRLAINELYARYGYIFLNEEMDAYYRQFSWYSGDVAPEEFSTSVFNQIEQQNFNLLVGERSKRKDSN